MLLLLRRKFGEPDQIDHPQDAGHRGSDFVAHISQKIAFGAIGFFGPALGLAAVGDLLFQLLIHQLQGPALEIRLEQEMNESPYENGAYQTENQRDDGEEVTPAMLSERESLPDPQPHDCDRKPRTHRDPDGDARCRLD